MPPWMTSATEAYGFHHHVHPDDSRMAISSSKLSAQLETSGRSSSFHTFLPLGWPSSEGREATQPRDQPGAEVRQEAESSKPSITMCHSISTTLHVCGAKKGTLLLPDAIIPIALCTTTSSRNTWVWFEAEMSSCPYDLKACSLPGLWCYFESYGISESWAWLKEVRRSLRGF